MSSLVIMGTAAFWSSDQAEANATLDLALEHGINHIDVAPQYGNAQQVVGPWLESRRDRFFISCKTLLRTRDEAWADLQNSLALLRTDMIDLYQFHAITSWDEFEQICAPGGAAEAFRQARDEGLVRYLGITGHGMLAPAIQAAALERLDLDTVMFPLNARLYADADYRRDAERLLELAQEREWDHDRSLDWHLRAAAPGLRFALSQPVTCLASAADVRLLLPTIEAAERFTPMSASEQADLIASRAGDGLIFEPI